jgi:hypothetical protein
VKRPAQVDPRAVLAALRSEPEFAAEFARLVLPHIGALIAGAAAAPPERYSTRREGPRPSEFANRHRAWRDVAPGIPGFVKRGRWGTISRGAYDAWLESKGTTTQRSQEPPASASTVARPWSPAAAADDLRLRLVKGRAG